MIGKPGSNEFGVKLITSFQWREATRLQLTFRSMWWETATPSARGLSSGQVYPSLEPEDASHEADLLRSTRVKVLHILWDLSPSTIRATCRVAAPGGCIIVGPESPKLSSRMDGSDSRGGCCQSAAPSIVPTSVAVIVRPYEEDWTPGAPSSFLGVYGFNQALRPTGPIGAVGRGTWEIPFQRGT